MIASLPKIPPGTSSGGEDSSPISFVSDLSRSTEDLLESVNLPPRPEDMTPVREMEALRIHNATPLEPPRPSFLEQTDAIPPKNVSQSTFYSHRNASSSTTSSTTFTSSQAPSISSFSFANLSQPELLRLHANFDRRLEPFWARNVTHGTVRISLYTINSTTGAVDKEHGPLDSIQVPVTSDTGYFGHLFRVDWDTICNHPGGVFIAFADQILKHKLMITTEYIPPVPQSSDPPFPPGPPFAARGSVGPEGTGSVDSSKWPLLHVADSPRALPPPVQSSPLTATAQIDLTLSSSVHPSISSTRSTHGVRVISDIDDTIKVSGILHGVRAVFRNVFVRPVGELGVPGMPEWYREMHEQGVSFHYVVSTG